MNKTKIDWCDYTINPVKGLCRNDCWYCYAKKMYKRFGWDEHVRQDYLVFNDMPKKPSRIFVGSMHDIFGEWIPLHWIQDIINYCAQFSHLTFIFLTKNPTRYKLFRFPQNCWLGTSIESNHNLGRLYDLVISTKNRNKIFVSFEPMLTEMKDIAYYQTELEFLSWIIIGGLTPKPKHKKEWVDDLINYCRKFGIPVFLKENLKHPEAIREYPERTLNG